MIGLSNNLMSTSNIVGNVGGEPYQNGGNFSASFDGANDIAIATNSKALGTPLKPTAAITISCWVLPSAWDTNATNQIFALVSNKATGGYEVNLSSDGAGTNNTRIDFQIGVSNTGSGSKGYLIATVAKATVTGFSGWKNIVATYDGETAKLFVNGDGSTGVTNAAGAASSTIEYATSGPATQVRELAFGNNNGHNYDYNGLIDDVAIWNVALDQDNITKVYNSGTPFDLRTNDGDYNQSANLVGFWGFDEGTGTSSTDLIGGSPVNFAADATFSSTTPA